MMHEVALESKKLTHPSELETFCENLLTQASDTPSYPLSLRTERQKRNTQGTY